MGSGKTHVRRSRLRAGCGVPIGDLSGSLVHPPNGSPEPGVHTVAMKESRLTKNSFTCR